ncbi:MAG: peptidyl-prolyl cis-trans isomerase [Verrucomicrobiales bacterium]|nr:peptidyl-prolyl cis-trans isomerase [Verrucomicrobiales bacterium]
MSRSLPFIRSPRGSLAGLAGGVAGLAVWLVLAGCSKTPTDAGSKQGVVLAEVGDHKITEEDFLAEARRRGEAGLSVADKDALLNELVEREALLAKARQSGLDQDPALHREYENLLIARLVEHDITPLKEAVAITPDKVRAEYEANQATYTRPAQVRLAMLYLQADAKASDARRAEIRARLEEAREEAVTLQTTNRSRGVVGFGRVAIEHSDDQVSRYRGGDLGWIAAGQRPPRVPESVLEAGIGLETGAMSPVLETPQGFYLLMKTDSRPEFATPIESVQAALRQSLLARERRRVEETYRQDALQALPVQIHAQTLASVQLPEAGSMIARTREPKPPGMPGTSLSRNGN